MDINPARARRCPDTRQRQFSWECRTAAGSESRSSMVILQRSCSVIRRTLTCVLLARTLIPLYGSCMRMHIKEVGR
jgi:DTW domain-containing protein YfiP